MIFEGYFKHKSLYLSLLLMLLCLLFFVCSILGFFVYNFCFCFRVNSNAHLYANVNPLQSSQASTTKMPVQLFGFSESDHVSHEALRDVAPGLAKRVKGGKVDVATLVNHLHAIYCGTTSIEYDGMNQKEREWFAEAVERSTRDEFATPGFFVVCFCFCLLFFEI